MSIRLIVDSASDISAFEASKLGIVMLPMTITFGEEEYFDGVNLLSNEFYEKLANNDFMPKTSQIAAYRWDEVFSELTAHGDEVIAITISSKLSGTYDSAKQAAERFGEKVHVVDSLNACIGERLLCLYAISLIKDGMSAKRIAMMLDDAKNRLHVIAKIDTLEYLRRGGRISAAAAVVGGMLSIKPIIEVSEGEIKVIGKAVGTKKADVLLTKLINERGCVDETMPYGAMWSGIDKTPLDKYLENAKTIWSGFVTSNKYVLGGTIGTHVGEGAVGVAFFEK